MRVVPLLLRRRWKDTVAQVILTTLLLVLAVGFLKAQSGALATQVGLDAVLNERVNGLVTRIEHLETMVNYALLAMVGNLVAHLFQIQRSSGRRSSS